VSSQPAENAATPLRRRLASTTGAASHFGPAVSRKPAMNSGMEPMLNHSACRVTAGSSADTGSSPGARSSTANHQRALATH